MYVVNAQNPREVAGDEPRSVDSLCCCTWHWRLCPSLSSWKNVCKTLWNTTFFKKWKKFDKALGHCYNWKQ